MTDSVVATVPVTRIVIREKRRPWGWLLLFMSVGLGMWLLPATFGGTSTLIQVNGQSMEPTYSTGDLVGLRATADYEIGDVVGYKIPEGQAGQGLVVVHRLIGFDADGFLILQGDNNEFIDSWAIAEADVLGEKEFVVAGFGTVFGSMWTLAALLAIFAARIAYVATAAPTERIIRRINTPEVLTSQGHH